MTTNPEHLVDALLNLAIAEDIGDGDHSTLSCIPPSATGKVQLMMKQEGIIADYRLL
jgi:nicotinate-nucleotide pyrophosphorylase (carboxylating)